jgi:hypothetical protein
VCFDLEKPKETENPTEEQHQQHDGGKHEEQDEDSTPTSV